MALKGPLAHGPNRDLPALTAHFPDEIFIHLARTYQDIQAWCLISVRTVHVVNNVREHVDLRRHLKSRFRHGVHGIMCYPVVGVHKLHSVSSRHLGISRLNPKRLTVEHGKEVIDFA